MSWLVVAAGCFALPVGTGCSEDAPVDPCGQPVYGGDATDEAWRTMVDGEERALVGDPNAPVLTAPVEGQVFSAAEAAPRFTWTSTLAAGPRGPASPIQLAGDGPSESWLESLSELIFPKAYAHLPPITGDVYYLQIRIPDQECAYRVITTHLDWQVDSEAWAAMQEAAGQPLSLDIMSAYLTDNRITEGPYEPATPLSFTVGP